MRRQDDEEQVYIAANLTSGELAQDFQLGDGMRHGGFRNYALDPGVSYNVGLRSTVDGSDTPVFAVRNQPFGTLTE